MGAIRQSEAARGLLAALALLVLALHVVVPAGFMPVRTDRGVVVTLCTGRGAVNVVVAHGMAPDKSGHQREDGMAGQSECPFAASLQPIVPPQPWSTLSLPIWQRVFGAIAFALKTGVIARLAAPPPPSSGPPATF